MKLSFEPLGLPGAYCITRQASQDERGSFARIFCMEEFEKYGLCAGLKQISLSNNLRRGTLRGFHTLKPPYEEDKLIACTQGVLFDVLVDVRQGSKTFGKWEGRILSAENGRMLYIPKGYAHGFLTLEDDTQLLYLMTAFYHPEAERGYRYDEPQFGVKWPETGAPYILSEKDKGWGYLP